MFDKLVHLSADDFIMSEDTVIYDAKGKQIGSVNDWALYICGN